jgi:hypothetical protein
LRLPKHGGKTDQTIQFRYFVEVESYFRDTKRYGLTGEFNRMAQPQFRKTMQAQINPKA